MVLKKHFWIIYLILVTLLSWASVSLFLSVVSDRLDVRSKRSGISHQPPPARNSKAPSLSAYDVVVQNDIFNPKARSNDFSYAIATAVKTSGDEERKNDALEQEKNQPPQPTSINVKLAGIAVLTPGSASFAVIFDQAARQHRLYHTGDKIQDATISAIRSDSVLLTRNGKTEVLFLSRKETGTDQKQRGGAPQRPPQQSDLIRESNGQRYVLDREKVNEMISNVNQFMTQLRVRPYFNQGKPIGYMVSDIQRGSLIEQVGLRDGDIIKSVNGVAITQPDQAFAAYQQLLDESQITLELQRGQSDKVITYELR